MALGYGVFVGNVIVVLVEGGEVFGVRLLDIGNGD